MGGALPLRRSGRPFASSSFFDFWLACSVFNEGMAAFLVCGNDGARGEGLPLNLYALMLVAIVIPIIAAFFEAMSSAAGISERHHSHHDTFMVEASFSRAIIIAMFFMAIVGIILSWLCTVRVFNANSTVVISFFVAFIAVMFVMWAGMRRYRVSVYGDFMDITPFVGSNIHVVYKDIERMEWFGLRKGSGYRNLRIYENGRPVGMLWGVLDIEQILMRVDRFDVLGHASNS